MEVMKHTSKKKKVKWKYCGKTYKKNTNLEMKGKGELKAVRDQEPWIKYWQGTPESKILFVYFSQL